MRDLTKNYKTQFSNAWKILKVIMKAVQAEQENLTARPLKPVKQELVLELITLEPVLLTPVQ